MDWRDVLLIPVAAVAWLLSNTLGLLLKLLGLDFFPDFNLY